MIRRNLVGCGGRSRREMHKLTLMWGHNRNKSFSFGWVQRNAMKEAPK